MIDKERIGTLVSGILSDDLFLVDITVSKSNAICIFIDSFKNLMIDDCIAVSRYVEGNLDRETEDFELQVSSPGVGQPFKVRQQFLKNVGRQIELSTDDGKVLKGKLSSASESGIIISTRIKEKTETGKSREVARDLFFEYGAIKSAMTIAAF
jgi:ribosome maturation factor RimP